MTLGKSFRLSEPQIPYLESRERYTELSLGIRGRLVPGPRSLQIPKSPGVQVPKAALGIGDAEPTDTKGQLYLLPSMYFED